MNKVTYVLPAYMSVHHNCVWCLRSLEKEIQKLLQKVVTQRVGAGNQTCGAPQEQ